MNATTGLKPSFERSATALRSLNTPWGAALLTALSYGLFALARWLLLGADVSRFVIAGSFISAGAGAHVGLFVAPNTAGYDGQFYYLLALNPFSPHPALPGAQYDLPAYRAQRILYPLLVWALSLGGNPALVPCMLLLVNLAAVVAIGWLGGRLAQRLGVAPLWGLGLALYPGLLVGVASDLGDPLALACALGGVLCASQRRWGYAALWLSLAALARETTLAIALALLLAAVAAWLRAPWLRLLAREDARGAALAGVIPLGVALGWQVALWAHWGTLGALAAGANNVGIPLLGLLVGLALWARKSPGVWLMAYSAMVYLVGMAEVARRSLGGLGARAGVWGYLALAWGFYAALTLTLSVNVWDYPWNFLRGAGELSVLSALIALAAPLRARQVALGVTLALWLLCAVCIAPVGAPTL